MKITLLFSLIFFNIQNVFALEFIEDTNFYETFKSDQIVLISKKIKKVSNKQIYLNKYLLHLPKLVDKYDAFLQ